MRIFLQDRPVSGVVKIYGDDYIHLTRSLRVGCGEEITFVHGGTDFFGVVTAITKDCLEAKITAEKLAESEPNLKITLFQAMPKFDKFEQIIEKSVELGVTQIVPFLSERCVSRPKNDKSQRWQKISESAAKQSGRGIIPEVGRIISFKEAVEQMKTFDLPMFFYETGGERMTAEMVENKKTAAVMIGAEGGFSLDESRRAEAAGMKILTLGKRILRCETAPVAAVSILMYLTGEG
ncbi:MAG: 16S rRNA (uracil(1498)-N(3))-methyltransferase [Ruminococcus sp.]|nr:16S rRNA (uracil(1498)-N(3))-methyltransferase [Ruminococcus sp.]